MVEGLCHQCRQWVAVSNVKRKNSVLWYRHAHKVRLKAHEKKMLSMRIDPILFSAMFIISPKWRPLKDAEPFLLFSLFLFLEYLRSFSFDILLYIFYFFCVNGMPVTLFPFFKKGKNQLCSFKVKRKKVASDGL